MNTLTMRNNEQVAVELSSITAPESHAPRCRFLLVANCYHAHIRKSTELS